MIPVTPRLSSQRSRSSRINCAAPSTAFDLQQSRCPELSRRAQLQPPRSQRLVMCETLTVHIATSPHVTDSVDGIVFANNTISQLVQPCLCSYSGVLSDDNQRVTGVHGDSMIAIPPVPGHCVQHEDAVLSEVSCRHSVLKPNVMAFPRAGCLTVHR